MVTEERPERNEQRDDEEDDGCGRDYYDSEGIPVHVLDSGEEIKLPSIPQHYYGVKANGEHCRYPICEEREETIAELPAGVHTGPPGYLREVWDYARKAAYQARAKAAEAALAHVQERELKLQLYFLNLSMETWKHKALHLMRCNLCFGNSAATTIPANVSLPSPPSTMPPAAAVTANPMPELVQANAPTGPHIAPVEAPSSTTTPHPPPSSMANGAGTSVAAAAAAPVMNGTMSSLPNPHTTDAIPTSGSSIPQLPPPELNGEGNKSKSKSPPPELKGKGKNSKSKAEAKNKSAKTPTPKKNNSRKVGEKSKSAGGNGDGGASSSLNSWSLGLMWNAPKKRRT
ncbi:unnamed protein product [Linum trigynum]|uniref:Uncharacterized protein n=1 Tax=Linum trigynum TaxID=586398 RepID=A0AAV2FJ57_9ROSI